MSSNPNVGNYETIWKALKNAPDGSVVVNCKTQHMETLIQAVKKIKSTENAARKRLDDPSVPHYGRLVVTRDRENQQITFSLTYALENLV